MRALKFLTSPFAKAQITGAVDLHQPHLLFMDCFMGGEETGCTRSKSHGRHVRSCSDGVWCISASAGKINKAVAT
jgi:hypothetical protein